MTTLVRDPVRRAEPRPRRARRRQVRAPRRSDAGRASRCRPGFAVTTRAFDQLAASRPTERSRGEAARRERRPTCRRRSRRDRRGLRAARRRSPPVAVRSSAVAEDARRRELRRRAGHVPLDLAALDEVLDGVRRCWASYFNAEALAYRAQHGDRARRHERRGAVHGRRARRRRDVHAQPRHGRPVVDRDRRELRARRHGRRRRGDARLASSSRR